MVFGHILRELRAAAVVGRFDGGGPYVGECLSACVYALMGAVRRVAPLEAKLLCTGCRSSSPTPAAVGDGTKHMTRSFADPPMVAVLKRYARRMGVSPALVRSSGIAASGHRPRAQP